jgi:peptidoglycan/LPS O-acetylase OafA/YrhL
VAGWLPRALGNREIQLLPLNGPAVQLERGTLLVTSAPTPMRADRSSSGAPSRLHLLTFFRFVAALWILLFHLQGRLSPKLGLPWLTLAYNGAYAMSFFFVLSGTVLAYGYHQLAPDGRDTPRFYASRLARIYPVYAITHVLCLPWIGIALPAEWPRWFFVNVTSALGIQAWFPNAFVGANTGTWSISCEFFFYALFPALLPLARRLGAAEHFARSTLYVSLAIGFCGLADYAFAGEGTFPLYYISPALRLPEFFLGMLLGVALRRRSASADFPGWKVLAAAVAVTAVSLNTVYQVGLWTRANIVVVPAIAALIFSAAAYEISHVTLSRGQVWKLLRYLGEASYCFFLAQLPLLMWFDAAKARGSGVARWAVASPYLGLGAAVLIILIGAIILHEAVEKPFRRLVLARIARANG